MFDHLIRLTKYEAPKELPRPETALDRTTRAAQEIIDSETRKRDDKTERLRLARIERARKERRTPAKG
ncbi:hypothetical protein ACFQXB_08740 [Plastorhodobacter daqingensis]|uniref:Uncharacterized protein n=1 Tax=Plastorhodobacter daqingensis TaxID=1387281 RepID=A0ABW2UJ97_9RHOB